MTINELLKHGAIAIDEGRVYMVLPCGDLFAVSRCSLGQFVHHDDIGRESAERLIQDADAVFVRTEVTT